jgi:hypothetical protein
VLAGLGLLSGIASARLVLDSASPYVPPLRPLALAFGLAPEHLPIGLYFGAAVAVGTFLWTRKVWSLPVLPVTTMYAWSAAIQVAIRLQRHTGEDLYLVAASLAAGAVGAGLTHLGCALFAPGLRRPSRIAVSCLVGALAGMLLYMSERKMIDMQWLFIVWQPAVAFAIGAGLGRGRRA